MGWECQALPNTQWYCRVTNIHRTCNEKSRLKADRQLFREPFQWYTSAGRQGGNQDWSLHPQKSGAATQLGQSSSTNQIIKSWHHILGAVKIWLQKCVVRGHLNALGFFFLPIYSTVPNTPQDICFISALWYLLLELPTTLMAVLPFCSDRWAILPAFQ